MNKFDKYLKIVNWLQSRYTNNKALITVKNGKPSRYTSLEILACKKYLGFDPNNSYFLD